MVMMTGTEIKYSPSFGYGKKRFLGGCQTVYIDDDQSAITLPRQANDRNRSFAK
jgi:hypothetical protein